MDEFFIFSDNPIHNSSFVDTFFNNFPKIKFLWKRIRFYDKRISYRYIDRQIFTGV